MVPGFNHNVKHKNEIYHIQTEDSGVNYPHVITLLYKGGSIIAKEKTTYADIVKIENLRVVVRELMEEQHKEMLRKLTAGAFDNPSNLLPPKDEKPLTKDEEKRRFGEDVISEKSLDEVILDFLSTGADKS